MKDEIKPEGITKLKREEPAVLMGHIGRELQRVSKITGQEELMDGDIIVFLINSLVETYGNYLNLPDISYAISKGLAGQYGKTYGKVTAMVILEWIMWYEQGKSNMIANKQIEDSSEFKGGGGRSTGQGEKQFKESMRQAQAKYLNIKLKD